MEECRTLIHSAFLCIAKKIKIAILRIFCKKNFAYVNNFVYLCTHFVCKVKQPLNNKLWQI